MLGHFISHKKVLLAAALALTFAICSLDFGSPRETTTLQLGMANFPQPPLPVPNQAEVATAKKLLAEIYRDEFARANASSGAQKLAQLKQLSQKIAAVAKSETDPTRLYAIFDVAVEIGKLSGDIDHTSKLIDQFQSRFAIESLQLHKDAAEYWLSQTFKNYKTLTDQRAAYSKLGDDLTTRAKVAAAASKWETASDFYDLAAQSYSKAGDKAQATKFNQLTRQMKELKTSQTRIDRLLSELADSDDKPRLNLEIGSFFCFEVGNWKIGLPYLRDSNDKAIAEAATADLAASESSWENSGDLWWTLSQETSQKQHAEAIQKRAVTQYSKAMKNAAGLASAKMSKRILTAGGPVDDLKDAALISPAVNRGLKWLAGQQRSNGSWSLVGPYKDGAANEDVTAATAMALLAFLQAGYGPQAGDYKQNVKQALNYLMNKQDKEGFFAAGEPSHNQAYSQALASLAILEALTLTQDPKYKMSASQAVKYANWSQASQGGWRYDPRKDSDASITGWFVTLLTKAKEANFDVSEIVFKKAESYLESVKDKSGSRYSYQQKQAPSLSITAEAFRCRLEMGLSPDNPALLQAIKTDLQPNSPKAEAANHSVYYWLHATHVMRRLGGQAWMAWRNDLRRTLDELQVEKGAEMGSWSPDNDQYGPSGGRLYVTCFNLYCLQIADQYP